VANRRFPFAAVFAATTFALVAAVGAAALLGWGDESPASGGSGNGGGDDGMELSPQGELPDSVAAVRLGSLDGGADRSLGELIGTRPVVLNFFASWCAPCIVEMPGFEAVHQSVGDQVTVVGMAYQDSPEDALDTVAQTGVTYPTYADPEGSALTYFGGLSMPSTVFIDASGQVVDVVSGALSESELRGKITDLLGVPA
jgi:cytochrome c biogenesis protein CcmG/thiol:disulfide interchange protein DsbE